MEVLDSQYPRFMGHFHQEVVNSQGLFIISETGYSVLGGTIYETISPHITGTKTVHQIIQNLDGKVGAAEIYFTLDQLNKKGYLALHNAPQQSTGEVAYWDICNINSEAVASTFKNKKVCVEAIGTFSEQDVELFRECLQAQKINVVDTHENAGFTILLVDDYLNPKITEKNKIFHKNQHSWMLVKPIGISTWIGPTFGSKNHGCWQCLQQRLRGHRKVEAFIEKHNNHEAPIVTAKARNTAILTIAYSMAAQEIARTLMGASRTEGVLLTFDHDRFETQEHTLVKRSQCPVCGDPKIKQAKAILFDSNKKNFTSDGGHRTVAPIQTVNKYKYHISPITGIINEIRALSGTTDGIKHIYSAGHNFAMLLDDVSFLKATLRMGSGGKGKDDTQAQASAIGEALERYSGVFQGDEPRKTASLKELGDEAIDPSSYLLYSDWQFDNRERWNKAHDRYQYVPERFDPTKKLEWTPLWSLTHQRFKYLPTACCYYGYAQHLTVTSQNLPTKFSYSDSNGAAAGNTLEEAILQGFFELAERDSVACWWYSRVNRPGVDLDSFNDPYFARMRNHYKDLGRTLWVIDVTNDLEIPTFVAVSYVLNNDNQEIIWGCGSHLDPAIGISRALTEANQFLAAFESFADDKDRHTGFDPEAVAWFRNATIEKQSYLKPSEKLPIKRASDYKQHSVTDIVDDLEWCVAKLKTLNMEMYVLDQTREDVKLPVVKVVVPGLRHFFARFAPGRLYDVPVKLGWVNDKLKEDELNPIPVFF